MNILETNIETVCLPVKDKVISPLGIREIPLPLNSDKQDLVTQFTQAPQFAGIDLGEALRTQAGKLRVILLGEHDYSLEECAMYLATLAETAQGSSALSQDQRWTDLDYDDEEEESSEASLTVLSSQVVALPVARMPQEATPQIRLGELELDALLVKLSPGDVVSKPLMLELLHCFEEKQQPHLFLSLQANQMDSAMARNLQLTHGFVVVRVKSPSQKYLEELFWRSAETYYGNIRSNQNIQAATVIHHLKTLQGKDFCQRDLQSTIQRSFPLKKTSETLRTEDFCFQPTALTSNKSGREKLDALVELEQVKTTLTRILSMEKLQQRRQEEGKEVTARHRHLAFQGCPGTGKTVSAQILAQILQEEGCGSGLFVEAGKEDMVGGYLGQTAPKVAKLFEKAQGGVLFLDEIGALAPKNSGGDSYSEEAINALVYHMDRSPETIVIFATYPEEMEDFLNSNAGLKSRIAQTLDFPSYEKASLTSILKSLCEKEGYSIGKKALDACGDYLEQQKKANPKTFGNGREVRRLFNGVEEEMALRVEGDNTASLTMSGKDVKAAIARLSPTIVQEKRIIGFAV